MSSISGRRNIAKSISRSAGFAERLQLKPELAYTGGERGWIGDSPFIFLDCSRIRALGWTPKMSIQNGVINTLEYLIANPWVVEARP